MLTRSCRVDKYVSTGGFSRVERRPHRGPGGQVDADKSVASTRTSRRPSIGRKEFSCPHFSYSSTVRIARSTIASVTNKLVSRWSVRMSAGVSSLSTRWGAYAMAKTPKDPWTSISCSRPWSSFSPMNFYPSVNVLYYSFSSRLGSFISDPVHIDDYGCSAIEAGTVIQGEI